MKDRGVTGRGVGYTPLFTFYVRVDVEVSGKRNSELSMKGSKESYQYMEGDAIYDVNF